MQNRPTKISIRKRAFEKILNEALLIRKDSDKPLTVIYDEDFMKFFDSLLKVLTEWNIPSTFIFIPKHYQSMMLDNKKFLNDNDEIDLPPQISGALQSSAFILNFLNGDSKYSKIRGSIISLQKQTASKMVHSPGIGDDVLKIVTKSPFKKIYRDSELVAWALGNTFLCKIISADSNNREYTLSFNIEGWENEPFMSPGKIFDDSWGNIPPGESFCCPEFTSVNGQICINGSLPGYLLYPNEEVVLQFRKGKMIQWESTGEKAKKYFSEFEKDARNRDDNNWNSFAEFGIGLNPMIKKLVGNALFDEKMGGTIHIALGDNRNFGHGIGSFYHDDLVCMRPTVILDENVVIEKGVLAMNRIRAWKRSISFEELHLNERDTISFNERRIQIEPTKMHRMLSKGDRKGKIGILNGKYESLYGKFKAIFRNTGDMRYRDLKRKFQTRELVQLKKMLSCFHHYKIIDITRDEN
ncbi:aminopeptidase [Dyadobacter helix]|nr:aminopeptidase [Dyadobacter sp. CECT 9275]